MWLSGCLAVWLSGCLAVCLAVCLSGCLSVCLCLWLSASVYVCLCLSMSIYVYPCLCVLLFKYAYVYLCLSMYIYDDLSSCNNTIHTHTHTYVANYTLRIMSCVTHKHMISAYLSEYAHSGNTPPIYSWIIQWICTKLYLAKTTLCGALDAGPPWSCWHFRL